MDLFDDIMGSRGGGGDDVHERNQLVEDDLPSEDDDEDDVDDDDDDDDELDTSDVVHVRYSCSVDIDFEEQSSLESNRC